MFRDTIEGWHLDILKNDFGKMSIDGQKEKHRLFQRMLCFKHCRYTAQTSIVNTVDVDCRADTVDGRSVYIDCLDLENLLEAF